MNQVSSPDRDAVTESSATNATSINTFDPGALRLTQDFATLGVKKALTTVPVRKANRQDFIRVRPEEGGWGKNVEKAVF